jgi:hypothetical protein
VKRTQPIRRRRPGRRRSDRQHDAAFLAFVHTLPCCARDVPGHVCSGGIEADHMGARPMGRRADDSTCAPICSLGHRQRTDFSGPFRSFDQAQMRAFLAESIRATREAYARYLLAASAA